MVNRGDELYSDVSESALVSVSGIGAASASGIVASLDELDDVDVPVSVVVDGRLVC